MRIRFLLVLSTTLFACDVTPARTAAPAVQSPLASAANGRTLAQKPSSRRALNAYKIVRTPSAPSDVVARANKALRVLAGPSQDSGLTAAFAPDHVQSSASGLHVLAKQRYGLWFRQAHSQLFLRDTTLSYGDTAGQPVDLKSAQSVVLSALQNLVSEGLLPSTGFDLKDVGYSTVRTVQGTVGQTSSDTLDRYTFQLPRRINGFPLVDGDAEISVHRSGAIAALKLPGLSVVSVLDNNGDDQPDSSGYSFEQAVDQDIVTQRAKAEYPDATVTFNGIQYWPPTDPSVTTIEPRATFTVQTMGPGNKVASRPFLVTYSLKSTAEPCQLVGKGSGASRAN